MAPGCGETQEGEQMNKKHIIVIITLLIVGVQMYMYQSLANNPPTKRDPNHVPSGTFSTLYPRSVVDRDELNSRQGSLQMSMGITLVGGLALAMFAKGEQSNA